MITFDEGYPVTLPATEIPTYTILLGQGITKQGSDAQAPQYYNHYSLLKTVELNWNLGNLVRKDAAKTTNVIRVTN